MEFVAIDIETADSKNSSPCALALTLVKNGEIVEKRYWLINPEVDFNPFAVRIHHITPEMVQDSPTISEIWEEIRSYIQTYPVVAHNAMFDVSVLEKVSFRYDLTLPKMTCYCTVETAKAAGLTEFKLAKVCKALGVPLEKAHDAQGDADACAKIFLHFLADNSDLIYFETEERLSDKDTFYHLSEFDQKRIRYVRDILDPDVLASGLVRYEVKKKLITIRFYYDMIRMGTVRKRQYISIRTDVPAPVVSGYDFDFSKSGDRFWVRHYIDTPSDVLAFSDVIRAKGREALKEWGIYCKAFQGKTTEKRLLSFKQSTHGFI